MRVTAWEAQARSLASVGTHQACVARRESDKQQRFGISLDAFEYALGFENLTDCV